MGSAATESILHGDSTLPPGLQIPASALLESNRPAGVALCLVTIGWASAGIRAQHRRSIKIVGRGDTDISIQGFLGRNSLGPGQGDPFLSLELGIFDHQSSTQA